MSPVGRMGASGRRCRALGTEVATFSDRVIALLTRYCGCSGARVHQKLASGKLQASKNLRFKTSFDASPTRS
jgi:hypothetical protein